MTGLTQRQLQVLRLMAGGRTARQIAESLRISVNTVEAHRENMKRKLKLKTTAELLRYAVQFVAGET